MAKKEENQKKEIKENKVKKHFFRDFKAELKRVIWPTPKQLVNNTLAVIAIVLIVSVIVFILDTIFKFGNEYGITNLQELVQEKFSESEVEEVENKDEESTETEEQNIEVEETPVEEVNTTENTSEAE